MVDTGTVVPSIGHPQFKDRDNMAWEPYKVEIGGGDLPSQHSSPLPFS